MTPRDLFELHTAGALFTPDGLHRLRLWRLWDRTRPVLVCCLLNPSVAGADSGDLTLAKCCGFAKRNGYGGVLIVNLFTLVSTNPDILASRVLTANADDANEHIRWACTAPPLSTVMVGWGSKPWAQDRARVVLAHIKSLRKGHVLCLGTTKDGSPKHPSRLGYDTPLVEL